MTEPLPHDALNEAMLAEIALGALLLAEPLGRDHFDERVIAAMRATPRHDFVPPAMRPYAHLLRPLEIGHGKTVASPMLVALMTDLLRVGPEHTVLEVGTGLGYHAAVVSQLAGSVVSMEVVEPLAGQAAQRLARAGRRNVEVVVGNGAQGLPGRAPFDRILVTCAPEIIPPALIRQLRPGGRMVVPAGLDGAQMLMLVTRADDGRVAVRDILPVGFGAMEGQAEALFS